MNATEDEDQDLVPVANHALEVDPEKEPDVIQAEIVVTDPMIAKDVQNLKINKSVAHSLVKDLREKLLEKKGLLLAQDRRHHVKTVVITLTTVIDTVILTVITRLKVYLHYLHSGDGGFYFTSSSTTP